MTNDEIPNDEGMTNDEIPNDETKGSDERPYGLEERTAQFGEQVIDFAKKIPVNPSRSD